jgi:hypothetical protein
MDINEGGLNRKRVIALSALVLLVIIIVILVWWWFVRPFQTQPAANTNTGVPTNQNTVTVTLPAITNGNAPSAPAKPQDAGELQIMNLARNFAERYDSWSTDSNYQNLRDLYPRITGSLRAIFEQTIATAPATIQFRAARAKAISIVITSRTNDTAAVTVIVQETLSDTDLHETSSFRTMDLTMVKQADYWFVDSVVWKGN